LPWNAFAYFLSIIYLQVPEELNDESNLRRNSGVCVKRTIRTPI
jgi:hypothetical protein